MSRPIQIVILGASGDLTSRKLVPALLRNYVDGAFPQKVPPMPSSRPVASMTSPTIRVIRPRGRRRGISETRSWSAAKVEATMGGKKGQGYAQ